MAYVDIEPQDRVLLARPLESRDLRLQFVLRRVLLLLPRLRLLLLVLRRDIVVAGGLRPSVLFRHALLLIMLLLLLLLVLLVLPLLLLLRRPVARLLWSVGVLRSIRRRLVAVLCYRRLRQVLPGHVIPEARPAGLRAAGPRARSASRTVIHPRRRPVSQCAFQECSFRSAALEAEVGGLACDWSFAVSTRSGSVKVGHRKGARA